MMKFIVCVPYFSLPEFPQECNIVKLHGLLPRDILLSNPRNGPHRKIGFQYDPAIDVGKYSVCQPNARAGLVKRLDNYNELFILFRTRYVRIRGSSFVLVTGFFKVDKEKTRNDGDNAIYAESMHFVSVENAIDITSIMSSTRAQRSSPSSENGSWERRLVKWHDYLKTKPNVVSEYEKLCFDLKVAFKANEFHNKRYLECESCIYLTENRESCPLLYRQNRRMIKDSSKFYDVFYPT